MYLMISIFFVGILLFWMTFYNSFMFGADIYLFFYEISNIEFVIVFYIFLALMMYLLIKKIKSEFVLVQLLSSGSLLSIGEYTYFLFLQFVFLLILFESEKVILNTISFFIYLLALHKTLSLLFFSSYPLYFANLSLVVYTLFLKTHIFEKFKKIDIFIYLSVLIFIFAITVNIQSSLFDFEIWLDVNDSQNYEASWIVYVLFIIHVVILMSIKRVDFKLD